MSTVRISLTVPAVTTSRFENSALLLDRLREAWRQAHAAASSTKIAHGHCTDPQVVFGTTGFAVEHIERAMNSIEDAAAIIKRHR